MIHFTADGAPSTETSEGTRIWQYGQVREGAIIGTNCILRKGVYIDSAVRIGNNVKIQTPGKIMKVHGDVHLPVAEVNTL